MNISPRRTLTLKDPAHYVENVFLLIRITSANRVLFFFIFPFQRDFESRLAIN